MARSARVVAFSTTAEMAERIDRAAMSEGVSRSELLRRSFEAYAAHPGGELHVEESGVAYLSASTGAAVQDAVTLPSPLPGLARVIAARDEIRGVCSAFGVHRLWLFGSAMRPDFHPERSDFDFQVEWLDAAPRRPWQGQLLARRDALGQVLDAVVDIGERVTIENPYLREAIERERLVIYDSQG